MREEGRALSTCEFDAGRLMRLADNVEVLELPTQSFVGGGIIHPTLIWDDNTVVLVDAGFPGQLQQIREAMGSAGVPFDRLDKVIITHHDIDHIGSLPEHQSHFPPGSLSIFTPRLASPIRALVTIALVTIQASIPCPPVVVFQLQRTSSR